MRRLRREIEWLTTRDGAMLMLGFALGTFQTCLLLLIGLASVYFFGDLGKLLSGLGTAAGFGLFLLLWLPTLYCTLRALDEVGLRRLPEPPAEAMLVQGLKWGGIDGMLFLVLPALPGVLGFGLYSLVTGDFGAAAVGVYGGALVLLIAATVACFVGAQVGLIAATLQIPLLLIAQGIADVPPQPEEERPA